MQIAIIGAGAAGFFAALSCATHYPNALITLYEKSNKLLGKVKVSGGGRCNVTNHNFDINHLSKHYPRGAKALKKTFSQFAAIDTIAWFASEGVLLNAESDGRMFPTTNDSQTIIDCLLCVAKRRKIAIKTGMALVSVMLIENKFQIDFANNNTTICDRIIVATGGNPNDASYQWLRDLGHATLAPVPSLFTFNVPNSALDGLQGLVVKDAVVKIKNTDLQESGITLVTHWGYSGPAILRLSAWGARLLKEMDYRCSIHVNWVNGRKDDQLRSELLNYKTLHPLRLVTTHALFDLPKRLWERLCAINNISENIKWGELPNKSLNKLIESLLHDVYAMEGKTTFKEEFVTAGGVDLNLVNMETMESNIVKGLYFAGEVLDVDGITGGYNFQAAWTTGWVAGKNICKNI